MLVYILLFLCMMKISVVIIAKNEAHIIANTIKSVRPISDDIVIVDNGSTDNTISICKKLNAHVIETNWEGYGITKNKGIKAAKNDWILSLDADEALDEELQKTLLAKDLNNEQEVVEFKFKNFYCNKWIRFGEWGYDRHIRLFNRTQVTWNNVAVHENLQFPETVKVTRLKGNILHFTVQDPQEYSFKTDHYARMNAKKYFEQGKTPSFFKLYFSPLFAFLQHYIFQLGFLDGKEGFIIAKTTARYTFLKYNYLKQMQSSDKSNKN